MINKKLIKIVLLCLVLLLFITLVVTPSYAQKKDDDLIGADKDLATKKGVSGSLATKEFDKNKLPGKWKIGFAVGSVIAAVAVVKWL